MFGRTQRAKVVGLATDCYHQRVVIELLRGRDLPACRVVAGGQLQRFSGPVYAYQSTQSKLEMVPAGLGQVFNFFGVGIKAACRHLMQQGLPHVGAGGIHQRDLGQLFFTQAFAQLGRQRQTACASSNNNDALHETPSVARAIGRMRVVDVVLPLLTGSLAARGSGCSGNAGRASASLA